MADWLHRPLERVYAAVCIDAIVVKVRDGQATFSAGLHRYQGDRGRH